MCLIGYHEPEIKIITLETAKRIHEKVGSFGCRDENALDATLQRPLTSYGGVYKYKTFVEKTGALFYGLGTSHHFLDGNKRTTWIISNVFVQINGWSFDRLDDDDAFTLCKYLADNRFVDESDFTDYIGNLLKPRR